MSKRTAVSLEQKDLLEGKSDGTEDNVPIDSLEEVLQEIWDRDLTVEQRRHRRICDLHQTHIRIKRGQKRRNVPRSEGPRQLQAMRLRRAGGRVRREDERDRAEMSSSDNFTSPTDDSSVDSGDCRYVLVYSWAPITNRDQAAVRRTKLLCQALGDADHVCRDLYDGLGLEDSIEPDTAPTSRLFGHDPTVPLPCPFATIDAVPVILDNIGFAMNTFHFGPPRH